MTDAARALVARTCAAQGLPERLADDASVARVVALLRAFPKPGHEDGPPASPREARCFTDANRKTRVLG